MENKKRTTTIRTEIVAAFPSNTGNALFPDWCRAELLQGNAVEILDSLTGERFRLVLEGNAIKLSALN